MNLVPIYDLPTLYVPEDPTNALIGFILVSFSLITLYILLKKGD